MKKLTLFVLCLIFSGAAFAVNSGVVSHYGRAYPSAGIDYYLQSEEFLLIEATRFCDGFNEKVDTMSNVIVQIHADFSLRKNPTRFGKTKAESYPEIFYRAVVKCKAEAL